MLSTVDTGSGPPVLLLHGQPGSKASWAPLIGLLAPRFRVLAPDRPGYGDTEGEAMDMAENADVLAEFLRSRDAAPATVVAHSWSGGVAILLAHRHPDTVRSLVLVGAVGTPDSVNGLDRLMVVPGIGDLLTVGALTGIGVILPRTRQLVNRMSRTGRGSAVIPGAGRESSTDRHRRREDRRSKARSYVEVTLPNERTPGGWRASWGRERRTFMSEQRALLTELPTVTGLLSEIRVPTTVVAGSWDVVVPPSAARSLTAAIPGAELVVIPDIGHFVARDAPAILAEVIADTDQRAGSPLPE
ncbi:MAG TPA: alpha/beta hydrolase [Acidimicrobiales bacterium]|jgi:pimeloyl-ACP methyl ester carboxylesterase|nr:alpha/beta hydrolase [Acidimicrobiales bacterium]